MQELWKIYHHNIPEFISEFMTIQPMQRLKDVGMNCGVEYTNFPVYHNIKHYSRYDHSIGVALIVWHFTKDIKQTIAGLLHDLSTPVFAHTIDFMNGDYLTQESTEGDTKKMIEESKDIQALLKKYHLKVTDVCDYHMYPIADNDSPQLSADRLEYTLGSMYSFLYTDLNEIKQIYDDLIIGKDENQQPEIVFQTKEIAIRFFRGMMNNANIFVSDEDRISMEILAQIVYFALKQKIITHADLYTNETSVIKKLMQHNQTKKMWLTYQNFSTVKTSPTQDSEKYYRIDVKKRYIDPLVQNQRLSSISKEVESILHSFCKRDFNMWIRAE